MSRHCAPKYKNAIIGIPPSSRYLNYTQCSEIIQITGRGLIRQKSSNPTFRPLPFELFKFDCCSPCHHLDEAVGGFFVVPDFDDAIRPEGSCLLNHDFGGTLNSFFDDLSDGFGRNAEFKGRYPNS